MMKEKKLSWEELEAKAIYTPEIEDEEIEETKNNKKTKISLRQRQSTPKIHTKKEQKTKGTTQEPEQKSTNNKTNNFKKTTKKINIEKTTLIIISVIIAIAIMIFSIIFAILNINNSNIINGIKI